MNETADRRKLAEERWGALPYLPFSLAIVLLYSGMSILCSLLVFGTYQWRLSHVVDTHLLFAGRIADFAAKFVPAIDYSSEFLRTSKFADRVDLYRSLISSNWLIIVVFFPIVGVALIRDVGKNVKPLLLWVRIRYPIEIKRASAAYGPGFEGIFSDPLGKTRLFIGGMLIVMLALVYRGYVFTWLLSMPVAYLVFIYWCFFAIVMALYVNLVLYSSIRFFEQRANSQVGKCRE